jgi:AcrR family transcriptional regulator
MPDERDRIVRSLVELVGANGYRQTRLTEVLGLADVSESDFHTHFADKQQCFVAVWDELTLAHAPGSPSTFSRPISTGPGSSSSRC